MKVHITGAKGQLGIEISKLLNNQGFTVFESTHCTLDITDLNSVLGVFNAQRPDAIINCAAYTNVDGCETNEKTAYRANAIGARNLAIAANAIGAKIVQISTDYVFDGIGNTPWREYDKINPQSVYGKSKVLGEQLVAECNPRHIILRTAWLYGEGTNFVKTMLKIGREKGEVSVVGDQYGTPTATAALSRCIADIIKTEHYGLYHATCEGQCSWYDLAVKIFELKGMDVKVNKITTEELGRPAPRPKYSVLDNFMLNLIDMNCFRSWEEALEEYLRGEA